MVDDGFYYDIYLPDVRISPDDFPAIEAEMQRIAKENLPFRRFESTGTEGEAYARYRAIDGGKNPSKAEIVEGLQRKGEALSFYQHGDFIDLCRGPHVPSTVGSST